MHKANGTWCVSSLSTGYERLWADEVVELHYRLVLMNEDTNFDRVNTSDRLFFHGIRVSRLLSASELDELRLRGSQRYASLCQPPATSVCLSACIHCCAQICPYSHPIGHKCLLCIFIKPIIPVFCVFVAPCPCTVLSISTFYLSQPLRFPLHYSSLHCDVIAVSNTFISVIILLCKETHIPSPVDFTYRTGIHV